MGPLTRYFGFVQFELAGEIGLADGRYLARGDGEEVLVIETLGAAPAPRRRWRPAEARPEAAAELPLTRATAIRAFAPYPDPGSAAAWAEAASADREAAEAAVAEGLALLNRALFAQAAASADPYGAEIDARRALRVRIGSGSGDELAAGRFALAYEVEIGAPATRRERREAELRPQERVAAVLGGRERIDACEPLLLRARADLDAGRVREAALQLRVGLEALLVELAGALVDPAHGEDMAEISARRHVIGAAANMALQGGLDEEHEAAVREALALCERVLRRRRVLRG